MALIKTVCGLTPKWGEGCYFSENATIVGDVQMGDQCTVWFNAVVRGDVNYIRIGNRVNIQDGSCLHTLYQKAAIEIGDEESQELLNIPFPYSIKGDKFTSLLISGDYTNTVTVSFKDDDTMIFYMNDSGYMEDNRGYEEYESWITYRRVK
jgi:hypothetical protein